MRRVVEVRRDILSLLGVAGRTAKALLAIEADGRYELGHLPLGTRPGVVEMTWTLLSDVFDAVDEQRENLEHFLSGGE